MARAFQRVVGHLAFDNAGVGSQASFEQAATVNSAQLIEPHGRDDLQA